MNIGYARVSSDDQNPQLQIDALKDNGCAKIFTDHMSGAVRSRPQLDECLKELQPGDVLIVWKLDRLGRSMIHLCGLVAELLERGVGLKVLTQQIDTTNAGGMLCFHIFVAVAEFERELIRERTKAGLGVARAAGKILGRPPKMDEFTVEQFDILFRQHLPIAKIAQKLDIPVRTAYRHVTRHYNSISYQKLMRDRRIAHGLEPQETP